MQSLSQLFLPTYFVKCRRTLLEFNSSGPCPSSGREIKFPRCLFTYSIKREIRHFHVVVVQKRAKKCTEKRDALAKLLFCLKPIVFCCCCCCFFVFCFWRSRSRPRRWNLKCLMTLIYARSLLGKTRPGGRSRLRIWGLQYFFHMTENLCYYWSGCNRPFISVHWSTIIITAFLYFSSGKSCSTRKWKTLLHYSVWCLSNINKSG